MAKHVLNPIDQLQVPLIRSLQEALARMPAHARYTPQHSTGWYTVAEEHEQMAYAYAELDCEDN